MNSAQLKEHHDNCQLSPNECPLCGDTFTLILENCYFKSNNCLWVMFHPQKGTMEFRILSGADYCRLVCNYPASDEFNKVMSASRYGREEVPVPIETQRIFYKQFKHLGWQE